MFVLHMLYHQRWQSENGLERCLLPPLSQSLLWELTEIKTQGLLNFSLADSNKYSLSPLSKTPIPLHLFPSLADHKYCFVFSFKNRIFIYAFNGDLGIYICNKCTNDFEAGDLVSTH